MAEMLVAILLLSAAALPAAWAMAHWEERMTVGGEPVLAEWSRTRRAGLGRHRHSGPSRVSAQRVLAPSRGRRAAHRG